MVSPSPSHASNYTLPPAMLARARQGQPAVSRPKKAGKCLLRADLASSVLSRHGRCWNQVLMTPNEAQPFPYVLERCSSRMREPVIYVVDDDKSFRTALTRLLEAVGYVVRPYASAEDFLSDINGLREGCMILDINLPGANGFELQEGLCERHSTANRLLDWQRRCRNGRSCDELGGGRVSR